MSDGELHVTDGGRRSEVGGRRSEVVAPFTGGVCKTISMFPLQNFGKKIVAKLLQFIRRTAETELIAYRIMMKFN